MIGRTCIQLIVGVAVAALAAAAVPSPAPAAVVAMKGRSLTFTAAPGELNVVDVGRYLSDYADGYSVREDEAELTAGRGCRLRAPGYAVCLRDAVTFRANLGDGDDMLTLRALDLRALVSGGDGDDLIETGAAADKVSAGAGTDTVVGNGGDDTLAGGDDGDLLHGSDGADDLDGQSGDDVAMGQEGSGDGIFGGLGRDLLLGGDGNDTLEGEASGDALFGGEGADRLDGGAGNDQLTDVGQGSADVECGPGNDRVRVGGGEIGTGSCAGAPTAPAGTPAVWPPPDGATAARLPTVKRRVKVRARRRGRARSVSLQVSDVYYREVTVRVRFYSSAGRYLGQRSYDTTTRNPRNVYHPRPPVRAHRARGRCCY